MKTITIEIDDDESYMSICKKFYDAYTAACPDDPEHCLEDGMFILGDEIMKKKAVDAEPLEQGEEK